jgi:hypothetical protein
MTNRWIYLRGITQTIELDGKSVPGFVAQRRMLHGHERPVDACKQCHDLGLLELYPLAPDDRILVYPAQ